VSTTSSSQCLIDQLVEDVKHVRPAVEKTRPNVTKNPDVDRLEEDVNRMSKRWGNCCMQVVERLRSCEAACELLEKYNMSYQVWRAFLELAPYLTSPHVSRLRPTGWMSLTRS
jgi:hypothetical protein